MLKWLAIFLVLWFIYEVREVFPPIIVGGIFAYLLLPVVTQLSSKAKIPIGLATAIVYVVLTGVLVFAGWYFVPSAVREIAELAKHQREIVENVITQFAQITHWDGDVSATAESIMNNLSETVGKPSEIAHLGKTVSHGALAVLVCVVSSIYFTLDSNSVGKFFLRYLPKERRGEAVVLATQMNKLLTKYVQGQLILIVLMSVVAWTFLYFGMDMIYHQHMKFALPVAILSGFLEIIPVLGPILAITTAVLVGMWQFGPECAPVIIIFYTIARWVEDYVVVPKVIGHAVELHPLAVIFAVLCGEKMAGALGMLIAIPVAACIKLFIDFFYFGVKADEHDESGPHNRDGEPSGPAASTLERLTEGMRPTPVRLTAKPEVEDADGVAIHESAERESVTTPVSGDPR